MSSNFFITTTRNLVIKNPNILLGARINSISTLNFFLKNKTIEGLQFIVFN